MTHFSHFEDALRVQATSAHLPHTGDRSLVCDGNDEAGHGTRLLLQSGVHHVPVAHLTPTKIKCRKSGLCFCNHTFLV